MSASDASFSWHVACTVRLADPAPDALREQLADALSADGGVLPDVTVDGHDVTARTVVEAPTRDGAQARATTAFDAALRDLGVDTSGAAISARVGA